jgi:hypothetical protein
VGGIVIMNIMLMSVTERAEVVPGLVELEVAVPHLRPAEW